MKKVFIGFLFFLLNFSFVVRNCECQWVQMSNGIGVGMTLSFASSNSYIFLGHGGGVSATTNNGENWYLTSVPLSQVYALASIGDTVFACAYIVNNGVYKSTNNGQNWSQTSLNNKAFMSIAISPSNYIFVGSTDTGIYVSTNCGLTWSPTSLSGSAGYILSIAISGGHIYAGTLNKGVCLSTNNGMTWAMQLGNFNVVKSLAVNGSNVYAGVHMYGVYRSSNYGTNWTHTSLNNQTVNGLILSGGSIIAGTDSGVYVSSNDGVNWTKRNEGLGNIKVQSFLIKNNYIYAATYTAAVWRRDLGEIVGIQKLQDNIPKEFSLEQNYPNPFNSMTNVKFQMSKKGFATIKVFDAIGREVATLVNEVLDAGVYQVKFDGGNLESGIYFYRLVVNGEKLGVKKMLMVK